MPGVYNIHPAQTPRTLSETRVIPFVAPDASIYSSSNPFPGKLADFSPTGTKTGFRICGVNLYPLQYTPATGKLTLYSSLTVKVTYSDNSYTTPALTDRQIAAAAGEVRTLVVNPEAMTAFAAPRRTSATSDAEYLIITDAAYVSTLDPLAKWHLMKGYNTVVKDVSWITSNYTGYDTQEKIRNFIIDYYTNHGTIYVLLAGANTVIPAREGYSSVSAVRSATSRRTLLR